MSVYKKLKRRLKTQKGHVIFFRESLWGRVSGRRRPGGAPGGGAKTRGKGGGEPEAENGAWDREGRRARDDGVEGVDV